MQENDFSQQRFYWKMPQITGLNVINRVPVDQFPTTQVDDQHIQAHTLIIYFDQSMVLIRQHTFLRYRALILKQSTKPLSHLVDQLPQQRVCHFMPYYAKTLMWLMQTITIRLLCRNSTPRLTWENSTMDQRGAYQVQQQQRQSQLHTMPMMDHKQQRNE